MGMGGVGMGEAIGVLRRKLGGGPNPAPVPPVVPPMLVCPPRGDGVKSELARGRRGGSWDTSMEGPGAEERDGDEAAAPRGSWPAVEQREGEGKVSKGKREGWK